MHIPFWVRKCHYCDFNSGPLSQAARRDYLEALRSEILHSPWRSHPVRTVFLGGGTPSELTVEELEVLVETLQQTFHILPETEWSIECNPGTVTLSFFRRIRELGFNRVSLGVQSFHDSHLEQLGRAHDSRQAREAYGWGRQAGFDNVNLDLIFALPDQTHQEWHQDLDTAISLAPDHLSLYQLTIEAGTEFGRLHEKGQLPLADDDLSAEMYEWTMDRAEASGYRQYEISNFAKPSRQCLHNWIYWRNQPYLGLGVSAASFIGGRRWSNTGKLSEYHRTAMNGRVTPALVERLPPEQAAGEEIMLALRTEEGFWLSQVSNRYRLDLTSHYHESLDFLGLQGLISRQKDHIQLTRRGKLLANEVCVRFLAD